MWVTTGGTWYNEAARYIGEEVRRMKLLHTNDNLVVIGFTKLTNVIDHERLKEQAHNYEQLKTQG